MQLTPCGSCGRHVRTGDACPFCGNVRIVAGASTSPVGRLSRAMVFASATLAPLAACGGKSKPAEMNTMPDEERHHGGGGCVDPDPKRIEELETRRDEAKTPEEKEAAERELAEANQPVCMPYGAPPRRRRVV